MEPHRQWHFRRTCQYQLINHQTLDYRLHFITDWENLCQETIDVSMIINRCLLKFCLHKNQHTMFTTCIWNMYRYLSVTIPIAHL